MTESLQLEGQKEYEVSFWVIAEEAAAEVCDILSSAKMTVGVKSPLASLKLAYSIKKHTSAFFGSCVFTGLPENIKQIDEVLARHAKVLRYLIITPPVKINTREPRSTLSEMHSDSSRSARASVASTASEAPAVSAVPEARMSVLSNEGLEKKLEEILK